MRNGIRDGIGPAFGGSPEEKPDIYQERSALFNAEKLKETPTLIIHGDADDTVPVWNSDLLYEKLKRMGGKVEYIRVPGCNHVNSIVSGLEDRILDFFKATGAGCMARNEP